MVLILIIEERIAIIEERTKEVLTDWETNYKGKASDRPRLLITGCPNSGVRDKIIKTVEELGADVVAFDCCNGTREKVEPVDENMPIYDALAKKVPQYQLLCYEPEQQPYAVY